MARKKKPGRPVKRGMERFFLECSFDDSIHLVEYEHGKTGFAAIIQLWQKIYSEEGYYCQWGDKNIKLFCMKMGYNEKELRDIIDTCFDLQLFDKKRYEKLGILTSKGIQKQYFQYFLPNSGRTKTILCEEYLLVSVSEYIDTDKIELIWYDREGNEIIDESKKEAPKPPKNELSVEKNTENAPSDGIVSEKTPIKSEINTHSIGEESIVENSIEEKNNISPPKSAEMSSSDTDPPTESKPDSKSDPPDTEATNPTKRERGDPVVKKPKSGKLKYVPSEEALDFVKWFEKEMLGLTQPIDDSDRRNWAKAYDDLKRLDKYSKKQIVQACINAKNDEFWADNFYAPTKLRDKSRSMGIKYIEKFLQLKTPTNNGTAKANIRNGNNAQQPVNRVKLREEFLRKDLSQ